MITKYKVPCDHCGKESTVELDQNIHQINENIAAQDKKIATLYKMSKQLISIEQEFRRFEKILAEKFGSS